MWYIPVSFAVDTSSCTRSALWVLRLGVVCGSDGTRTWRSGVLALVTDRQQTRRVRHRKRFSADSILSVCSGVSV